MSWTKELFDIYGLDDSYDPSDASRNVEYYTPESQEKAKNALRTAIKENRPYELELELVRQDGKRIWIRTRGQPVTENGKVVRVTGNMIDITDQKLVEEQNKILAANTQYSAVDLAGGVYRGVDKAVPTIGVWNVMICQAGLSTDLVYKLVSALYDHQDYLLKIHPSASYTTPENAVQYSPIPLHPGTIKYLKEKGITVPANLIP